MKIEQLMARGLSEEHARIAVELCRESFRGFVPKSRFDTVNTRLKEANAKLAAGQPEVPAVGTALTPEQITIQITMKERR